MIEVKNMSRTFNLPKPLFEKHSKKGVLLLHAYSGSSNDVRYIARHLEKYDYSVYLPIFSGHGTLEPFDILMSNPKNWQREVTEAVNLMKAHGIEQIAVFGLSMGGIFALDLLTENLPEVIGGGAFCSPVVMGENQVAQNFLIYAKNVWQMQDFSKQEIEEKIERMKVDQPLQLAEIEKFAVATAEQLSKVQVPVFLAQGGKDEMILPESVFQTAQKLTQTHITLQWYEKSGHVVTVDCEKNELINDLLAFLAKLSWNEV